ncbi:MAG: hypothetical protein RL737_996, partial [Bacteroidota bacterium]
KSLRPHLKLSHGRLDGYVGDGGAIGRPRREWSEIYTLFKLIGDQKLIAGDADLNMVENLFYPIIKIIRTETGGNYQYKLTGDLVLISGDNEELRISIHTFSEQASKLLNAIKGSTGSFSIPETEAFMKSVCCGTLKAKSTSKTDIKNRSP